MPLLIQDAPLADMPPTLQELWTKFPKAVENGKILLESPITEVGPQRLLYVNQREYAVIGPNDAHIDILGTEDATTCHILVLQHTGSRVTCLSHCDGAGMEVGIPEMVHRVKQMSSGGPEGRIELTMAGGFLDSRNESLRLSRKILSILKNLGEKVHLVTACITDRNDTLKGSVHFPVIYGLAVNAKTGKISRATFPNKGPALDMRSATHFVGFKKMLNIYNPQTGEMLIGPYNWEPFEDVDMYLALPDPMIKKYLSTSPEQEPADFATCVKAALRVIKEHPLPRMSLFADNRPWRFYPQKNGLWTRITN